MKRLALETTMPFQGLPELVAYDEGLFEKEGVKVEWVDRGYGSMKSSDTSLTDVKRADPFASHGTLLEAGKADMYNACEWGNYCRVGDSAVGSRQIGRRAIITFGAIVVRPDSPVFTPQQLANRRVGVPFFAGTHYLALQMLEGFVSRDQIVVCNANSGARDRFRVMMSGEVEGATLTEPYVTLAEKKGCRVVCSAFYHGTEVASDKVDTETYRAFNRAVREAVRRINANKRSYLRYFIDRHKEYDPDIATLKIEDLREGRLVVVDPAPIPADEMRRTFDWVKSWGMLEDTTSPLQLINANIQSQAHIAAE